MQDLTEAQRIIGTENIGSYLVPVYVQKKINKLIKKSNKSNINMQVNMALNKLESLMADGMFFDEAMNETRKRYKVK